MSNIPETGVKCAECGKPIEAMWVRTKGIYFCNWTCYNKMGESNIGVTEELKEKVIQHKKKKSKRTSRRKTTSRKLRRKK